MGLRGLLKGLVLRTEKIIKIEKGSSSKSETFKISFSCDQLSTPTETSNKPPIHIPSSISSFVLIKLEHIFHGRDFGFSENKKPTENPLRDAALLEKIGLAGEHAGFALLTNESEAKKNEN